MKARVLLDEQGKVVAIERPQRGTSSKATGAPHAAHGIEAKGQKFHDLELPDEFENIESAEDFHERLKPHLPKTKS